MEPNQPEERILIMAPVGQDAAVMSALLESENFQPDICCGPAECCDKLSLGAGVLLFTEEALELPRISDLLESLRLQPPWSELPLIVLTTGGETRLAKLLDLITEAARSVTVLERPMRGATLLRSAQVALRSRRRQYHVRDLMAQQERDRQQLREVKEALASANTVLEKRVRERMGELRMANEQLETFVYSVAHDLRSPLRSITAFSQLLSDDYSAGLDKNAKHLLNRIQHSSQFMDKLLLDLLEFGRAARAETELDAVKVQTAWDAALFQCATQIEQSVAQIQTADRLPTVRSHEATLSQCLANLLNNALKFVRPGVRPSIYFWAEQRDKVVRLWLEDNGIGIPKEEQDRVFRVFERLNGTRYPGTGIGLSIVRKGIERMGGKVGLESQPGQGSRFWIELPKAN
jgi:signal transduction histidine kinase